VTRTVFIIIPRRVVDVDDADDADVDGIILRVAVIAIDRIGTARNETERNGTNNAGRVNEWSTNQGTHSKPYTIYTHTNTKR
jgi:hypothetical protein